jgi:molybdopterin/thiamine biosynthesis adenylyltransferase
VEVVIGHAAPRIAAERLFVSIDERMIRIGRTNLLNSGSSWIPSILALLGACYLAAATLKTVLDALPYPVQDPLVIRFDELGIDISSLAEPVDIGHALLAGAGAVGNGFLWAARYLDMRGELDIADDDLVSSGNLNRQIWFLQDDIGKPKPTQLVARAQGKFPNLKLAPRLYRLQDLPEKSAGPWLQRLFLAVDSRRARRQLQNEFPGEVFDASTTDIREIVVHYNKQPTEYACLSCIYEADREEYARERHISESLGVSLDDVRSERISQNAALAIARRFVHLPIGEIVGTPYDTLFKRLCAESLLKTSEGRRIGAPFAFVSVLAGTMLALEATRRLVLSSSLPDFNYWRISAWHPPIARRRIMRSKEIDCAFCGNALLSKVNESLWVSNR